MAELLNGKNYLKERMPNLHMQLVVDGNLGVIGRAMENYAVYMGFIKSSELNKINE